MGDGQLSSIFSDLRSQVLWELPIKNPNRVVLVNFDSPDNPVVAADQHYRAGNSSFDHCIAESGPAGSCRAVLSNSATARRAFDHSCRAGINPALAEPCSWGSRRNPDREAAVGTASCSGSWRTEAATAAAAEPSARGRPASASAAGTAAAQAVCG